MPPVHGTTRSQDQLPELFERRIGQEQSAPAVWREECDHRLPSLRRGVEARSAQRLAYRGLLPHELGGDRVLDHDDPSPPVGEPGCGRPGERGLPGAEELGVWPVESADREREPLANRAKIRLARKVPRHGAAAIRGRIPEQGNRGDRPAGLAPAAEQRSSAGQTDQHQRGCRGRCPASLPEERSSPWRGGAHLLDAAAQRGRGSARGFRFERPGNALLQRQLALAPRAAPQVLLHEARLVWRQLAVRECGNQLLEDRVVESSRSHDAIPRFAFSSPPTRSRAASNCRPRLMRLITVPIGTDVTWAISRYFKPCMSCNATATAKSSGIDRSASRILPVSRRARSSSRGEGASLPTISSCATSSWVTKTSCCRRARLRWRSPTTVRRIWQSQAKVAPASRSWSKAVQART